MSFYQQIDQEIFMFPETSVYCTPLNGTLIVGNPATYPWYSRLNLIPDSIDYDMPIVVKEKVYSIGSGKHPSNIINKLKEPVEITLDMYMQDARFLAMASGTCSTAADGGQSHASTITITTANYAALTDGEFFLLYTIDASDNLVCYQVYMDVTGDDTGKPAAVTGTTAMRIDFVTGDGSNNQEAASCTDEDLLAAEIAHCINDQEFTASATTNVVTITAHGGAGHDGAVLDTRDSIASATTTGFVFVTTTNGSSDHTITESTGHALPTFGLHIEQINAVSAENIIVDLYGCVITGYEITIDYAEAVIKESVTIKCVYGATTGVYESTCPPPSRTIDVLTWEDLKEDTNANVIMDSTTDMTPEILNSLTLSITNDVEFYADIGKNYMYYPVAGKREITMKLVGHTQLADLWEDWKDTWNDSTKQYTSATGKLNSKINVERTDDHDEWTLSIYNWMIDSYALTLFSIDNKLMGIDITFSDATPNSAKRIIDSLAIADYVPKIYYNEANS